MRQRHDDAGISSPSQGDENSQTSGPRADESRTLDSESRLERILVAVDLGDGSDGVIRFAQRMGGRSTEIVLVHVVCDLASLLDPYLCRKPQPDLQADLALEGKARLQRLARECFEGERPPREIVLSGTVWSEVVATARRHRVDAIVVGAHVDSVTGEPALGGTVASILWHAPCAVTVVPPESRD